MNIFQSFLIFLLLLVLGGCAKPLQPDNYVERISPTWLDANRFFVAYPGKSADQKIVDLMLLRSAEVVLQNGFNYFIIVKTEDSGTTAADVLPGATADFIVHNGIRYQPISPASSNTIVCFKRKPQGFAYVALFVKASLRAKYSLDQPAATI